MNRNSIKCFLLLCLLAGAGSFSFAQNLSNRGTDFWVGYGHHQFMEAGQNNSQEMVLYFSAEQAANVTVTIDGTAYVRNYSVPANSVITSELIPKGGAFDARLITLSCSFVPNPVTDACGGEGVFQRKGIHITSDVPIVAYAHIYGSASSGASMLMPVETWGYSYVTLNSKQQYAANCFSWVYAIAQHDNTVIEVTPVATTRRGRPAGVPFTITLNRGEIYQTMAGPETGGTKNEMSGTRIRSIANAAGQCYPIAVFAGSSRTSNQATCGSGGGDNDNQQCFPDQAWGKRYLTAPTSSSTNASTKMWNTFKIAVKDPATIVKKDGVQIPFTSLIANSYYLFEANEGTYIESDQPVMVAQFMTGGSCLNGGVGDPEMMYISPIEQGTKRIGFYRNNEEAIQVNYLTLIIPTPGVASLRIDNSPTFDHSYPHPRLAGYTVVVKRWNAAKAQAIAESDYAFTAITYGLGSVESYGYNAGTLINNLNGVADIHNTLDPTTPSHEFTCKETPVALSMLMAYQPTRMVWKLSELGAVITPNTDVVDNAPVSNGTRIIDGITYYRYSLPGTYMFHSAGIFTIPVDCTHPSVDNCTNTEELSFNVEVREPPTAEFSFTHSGCRLDPVNFSSPDSSANGFDVITYNWSSPGGISATGQTPSITFPTAGIKPVTLEVISSEGCVGDTTINVEVFDRPVNSISANPVTVCGGGSITFTGSTNFAGGGTLGGWYWDFGDGNPPVTPGNGNPQTVTFPNYGSYTVRYTTSVSATCHGDTATQVVNVRALPDVNFSYPAGCLPADGNVQFSSSATTADGRAVASVLWDFGDPNATATNPNTSTDANPTHYYSTFGNYTIRFSATTVDGCTKDTVVNATFNMRPVLAYPALPALCQNDAAVSVATASVTNSVPGSGVYSGPGTTAAGMFDPALAGPGTHTIKYIFSSTAGCVDSISRTILVRAKPMVNFSIPTGACLPTTGAVTFDNLTTISDGQTMTWQWNFDDPNANAGNPNTSTVYEPSHNFGEGSFDVRLVATTPNGCVGDTTITQNLAVRPALDFPVIPAQCANITTPVSIATATVTNGVTGTGVYSGPGTTAAGMFNPSVAGEGPHTIKYIFTTSGGCVDSISRTVVVHPKPRVNFDVTTTGCLPTNGLVTFTNSSSVPAGQTLTYVWNFDDPNADASNPNTSTDAAPQHNFREGSYDILLTATTNNGCVHDTTITKTFSVKPELAFTAPANICESETTPVNIATATVLNNVTGTGVYSGPGTTAAGMFTPSVAGAGTHTIKYVFTTAGGCKDSLSRNITVYPKPRVNFDVTATGCLPTNGLVTFTNGSSVPAGQTLSYVWNFDDPNADASNPNTSTNPAPQHNFREGSYDILLTATTNNGCVHDTTITKTFSVKPELDFTSPGSVCENETTPVSIATATVLNNVTGTGVYSGPGTTAAGMFTPSLAGAGTHQIKYVFTTVGGCKDSLTRTVLVREKPDVTFSTTAGACLPTTGLVNFTNGSSVSDGQTLTYNWNFDDPNATASNPNTSTDISPNHNYREGTYDVLLTATTDNGCVHDTTITYTFGVKPALTFAPFPNYCEDQVVPVSGALAETTNNVMGVGVYSGPGITADGQFTPSAAGNGTHTIRYVFTTTGGCVDSISRTVTVNPKPRVAFTVTSDVCADQVATIDDNSTIPSGTIASWHWYFGNGRDTVRTTGANFTEAYPNFGTYDVKLVATSNNGCVSDTARQTVVSHSIPEVDFDAPEFVCMPAGNAAFVNTSVSPDGSDLTYQWNFGDGSATSTDVSPTHVYGSATPVDITLLATSPFGCAASVQKTLNDFFDQPIASFGVSPLNLCQGTPSILTDSSSAPNSVIRFWNWQFGDGDFSDLPAPNKTYLAPGNYTISLVVKNEFGCESDPATRNVTVYLQPVVDAGPNIIVPLNSLITLKPAANDSTSVSFLWTPQGEIPDPTVLRPTFVATRDHEYTLTAVGAGGCTASDVMFVKILNPVNVPNAFSPNGDGINDTWRIDNLIDYPGATVDVFNRYGQSVYSSVGYDKAWDGRFKGKELPLATYYYVINLKNGFGPIKGSVTIVK